MKCNEIILKSLFYDFIEHNILGLCHIRILSPKEGYGFD